MRALLHHELHYKTQSVRYARTRLGDAADLMHAMHHGIVGPLLFCTILAFVDAVPYRFAQCDGGDKFRLSNVVLDPWAPVAGADLNVTITGVGKAVAQNGRILVRFPGMSVDQPLCGNKLSGSIRCPLDPGPAHLKLTLPIPRAANVFAGRPVDGRAVVYDEMNSVFLCLDLFDVTVTSSRRAVERAWQRQHGMT